MAIAALIISIVALVVTAVGWFVSGNIKHKHDLRLKALEHAQNKIDAKASRRSAFLSFMAKIISEVQINEDRDKNHIHNNWWPPYLPQLHERGEIIKGDLDGKTRGEFVRLFELAVNSTSERSKHLDDLKRFVGALND